ncbi:MAG: ATP-dependent DNA helicase [Chthoniobacterales bacterium]
MISLHETEPSSPTPGTDTELVKTVRDIFSAEGILSKSPSFEYRAEQQEMACNIAKTLESGSHLVIEAGTGVGKSLAYLIPVALFAVHSRRRAIISTHTINLQEQLIFKDIPLAQKVLAELGIDFEAALMKGRNNYLCGTRLDRAIAATESLFTTAESRELQRIREWSLETKDGTLSDFTVVPDNNVWSQVNSEQHICTARSCGQNQRCFYQVARRRLLNAQVIVLNHTLFFSLLGDTSGFKSTTHGFLFANDFAVFDEAHTLEAVAAKHIGLHISQYGMRRTLLRLYNPRTKKGLFQLLRNSRGTAAITDILPRCDDFFNSVLEACSFGQSREYRIRRPGLVDAADLANSLTRLQELIATAGAEIEDENRKAEIRETTHRLRELRSGILHFLDHELDDHVYWVEKTGQQQSYINLSAAPIQIAEVLRLILFRDDTSAVLTSATLSTGSSDLSYFRNRIGATEVRAVQIGSPFNYQKQMKLCLVQKMPPPKHKDYEAALEKWIAHFTEKSQARAFVLFTSYRTMRVVAERMEKFFRQKKWDFLRQDGDLPRNLMLEKFRESEAAVLFGTESFWMGVDVVGDALSSVIITRLPFATPDHPLIQARIEVIENEGGRPFFEFSLPEAILKFRQGVGRLIRSKNDTGSIVVLDSRIVTSGYGKNFLQALPECPVEII